MLWKQFLISIQEILRVVVRLWNTVGNVLSLEGVSVPRKLWPAISFLCKCWRWLILLLGFGSHWFFLYIAHVMFGNLIERHWPSCILRICTNCETDCLGRACLVTGWGNVRFMVTSNNLPLLVFSRWYAIAAYQVLWVACGAINIVDSVPSLGLSRVKNRVCIFKFCLVV